MRGVILWAGILVFTWIFPYLAARATAAKSSDKTPPGKGVTAGVERFVERWEGKFLQVSWVVVVLFNTLVIPAQMWEQIGARALVLCAAQSWVAAAVVFRTGWMGKQETVSSAKKGGNHE